MPKLLVQILSLIALLVVAGAAVFTVVRASRKSKYGRIILFVAIVEAVLLIGSGLGMYLKSGSLALLIFFPVVLFLPLMFLNLLALFIAQSITTLFPKKAPKKPDTTNKK